MTKTEQAIAKRVKELVFQAGLMASAPTLRGELSLLRKAIASSAEAHIDEREALREQNAELLAALEAVTAGEHGVCRFDHLNPCWDNRPSDVAGKHWGVGDACPACTARAAIAKSYQPTEAR